jgi:hypothetical protein
MRGLPLLVFAVVLAGCATYAWTKPGVTPDVVARDETECRAQARDLATASVFAPGPFWGPRWGPWGPGVGPGPFWWGAPIGDPAWSLEVEQRVYDRCMAFKGYELVTVPKAE